MTHSYPYRRDPVTGLSSAVTPQKTADAHRYSLVYEGDGHWLVLYRDRRGHHTTVFSGDTNEAHEYFEGCTTATPNQE